MELLSQNLIRISIVVLVLLGLLDAKRRHFNSVGHLSNLITPDFIIASSGDGVEFKFLEGSHNIVHGEYSRPCRPLVEGSSGRFEGKELSSGLVGNEFGYDPEKYNTWTIKINGSSSIWFYDCHTATDPWAASSILPLPFSVRRLKNGKQSTIDLESALHFRLIAVL